MLSVLYSQRFHLGHRRKTALLKRKQTFLPQWEQQKNPRADHFDRSVQILPRYEIKSPEIHVLNKLIKFGKLNGKSGFWLSRKKHKKKTERGLNPEIKLNNPAPNKYIFLYNFFTNPIRKFLFYPKKLPFSKKSSEMETKLAKICHKCGNAFHDNQPCVTNFTEFVWFRASFFLNQFFSQEIRRQGGFYDRFMVQVASQDSDEAGPKQ